MMKLNVCSSSSVESPLTTSSPLHERPNIPISSISSNNNNILLSRRNIALLLSLVPCFPTSQPAHAFNLSISGPKDWLKEQKKKSIKYLLAPIDASRDMLRFAHQSLLAKKDEYEQSDVEELHKLLMPASRDCVPEERNSFVAFQAKSGVEVCTFKLVVKNASSLLDDNDPAKVEAEAMLSDLIRSFTLLNGATKEANFKLVSDREKIADALKDTLSSLDKFELGIKACIDV